MDPDTSSGGGPSQDIPTRPMRVKVLYTFDQDNKTNCLARFPNTLQIPAVAIDDNSQVGVIELQQCLQTITSASPEIISRLAEGDFTVYAYDYSEDDSPLVGQGMLSTALSASTAAGTEKAMITGRVCKNVPALFSSGVKETLEVKLRLVPVPTPPRYESAKSVDSLRVASPATSAGFDPNAWNASIQRQRPQHQMTDYFDFDNVAVSGVGDLGLVNEMFGLETGSGGSGSGQHMVGGVGIAETPTDPAFGFNPAFATESHSAPGSRAGSPMVGSDSNTFNEHLRHQSFSANTTNFADHSRPGSRASVRSEVQLSRHKRNPSTQSLHEQLQPQTEVYYNDDGQPRKRAKVTQTDWRGRSSFAKSNDLRVTAATAHSVQMHKPVPRRPGAPGSDLEPPPRAPTPVPQLNARLPQGQPSHLPQQRSFLRQASTMTANSDMMSDADQYSDALMSSPEEGSPDNSITAEGTPQDIPSSPPIFTSMNQPLPSSPGLPALPPSHMADSGYMSERGLNSSHLMNNFDDDDENRSPDAEDMEVAARYHSRGHRRPSSLQRDQGSVAFAGDLLPSDMDFEQVVPGDILPVRQQDSQGPKPRNSSTSKKPLKDFKNDPTNERPSRTSPSASRRGSLALPPNPSAGPSDERPKLKRKYTKRTRAGGSEAPSPAPSDNEGGGSYPKRAVIIKQRMQEAVANNEMPQFCTHCGAIETPTWRKLYVKYVDGKPSPLDEAEGEGETIGLEPLEWDSENHQVTRFVIRKSMRSMKKTREFEIGRGFEVVDVCNPCGLWFNKTRSMRPADRWDKKVSSRKSRKQKIADGEVVVGTDGLEPPSEAFFTDQIAPEDQAQEPISPDTQPGSGGSKRSNGRRPISNRPRANSMQPHTRRQSGDGMNASQLNAALTRAVQSSPVPFHGSQESPIEIADLTPKPTRRLLFPSPRREGEVKSLDDNGQASLNATPPSNEGSATKPTSSFKAGMVIENADLNVFEAFTFDKENMVPPEVDDDLAHLFEGSPTAVFKTPAKKATTPRSQRQLDHLLKTPTPGSRTRKPLSPRPNGANVANATAAMNDFMTSPSSSRYFLRSTPSRMERSPGHTTSQADSGNRNAAQQMTPFSRHLAQMLSDANESAVFTSPSRAFDFSDLPTFTTPGRNMSDMDWSGMEEILSSEFATFEDGKNRSSTGSHGGDQRDSRT